MKDDSNKKTDKKEESDQINLKGIRTLDSDLKEYKKNVEKYGEDQKFSYDPYLSTDQSEKDVEKEQKNVVQPEVKKESTETTKRVEETDEDVEEDIPFIELLKNKRIEMEPEYTGHEQVYNPRVPRGVQNQTDTKKPHIEKKKLLLEGIDFTGGVPENEENALREKILAFTKEHAEWKQKLEYYKKNQSKVLEEREDFVLNKEDIEKMLKPILEEEKKIEAIIKTIEEKIEATPDENQKRLEEKERWVKEDQRQKLEREKWAHMEDLSAALKLIEEKDQTYQTLVYKQKEAEDKLAELEKTKEAGEAKLRLREIKRLKVDIETNKTKLETQIKSFNETIERLNKVEKSIVLEKRAIDEREHQTKDFAEEKIMETKRWEIEDKLRKVEQERWQIVDKQKRLVEIMNDINEQYNKIGREEKETLAKIRD